MKTRSRAPVKSKTKETDASDEAQQLISKSLNPSVELPPKLFILPANRSRDACFVSLTNPAKGTHAQYFFDSEAGFHEFTRIAAPKAPLRSWFLAPESTSQNLDNQAMSDTSTGYITKCAELHVATPIDALFLLLPALFQKSASKAEGKQLFLSFDHYLDSLGSSSPQLSQLLKSAPAREVFSRRIDTACDNVDAGDESMYRLSFEKLTKVLIAKAQRMTEKGLPSSMEAKFVTEALHKPASTMPSVDCTAHPTNAIIPDEDIQSSETASQPVPLSTDELQQSTESTATVSTAATSVTALPMESLETPKASQRQDLYRSLLRLRVALNFILASYVPSQLHPHIQVRLSANDLIDFSLLDKYLEHLASLRLQAQALRTISDNVSRKRMVEEDEEKVEARAEKKRKVEEEEKKKKMQSHGVKQLAKVNTKGMQKLSSFFSKTLAKK